MPSDSTTQPKTSPEQTLIILGASGDLTARLLLPGLGALLSTGRVDKLRLVGSALDDWDDDRWRSQVVESFATVDADGPQVREVIDSTRYVRANVTGEDDLRALLGSCEGQLVIYFALPPAITEKACRALTGVDLPEGTRLAIEKPFGSDADSAAALNDLVTQLVPEDHVHRIDHFVAMSAVLNILGVRFANRVIEPLLNNQHVHSVDVIFDESLTLEGRAAFYDGTGAMADMIQSHLLEVLALFAMEPVPSLAGEDVRDGKAQILRATHIWDDDPIRYSRRARYTAGEIDGRQVPSFVDEDGIDPSRNTETFAELVLAIDTWRWAGVPFRVRSGKSLGSPRTEVTVTFQPPQHVPTGLTGNAQPNRLHIGIPLGTNTLALDVNISGPGNSLDIDPVSLAGEFGAGALPPYGYVLVGILEGIPPLSVRGDMAVQCWRIIEPVRQAWRENKVPMGEYAAGSLGPDGWSATGLPDREA